MLLPNVSLSQYIVFRLSPAHFTTFLSKKKERIDSQISMGGSLYAGRWTDPRQLDRSRSVNKPQAKVLLLLSAVSHSVYIDILCFFSRPCDLEKVSKMFGCLLAMQFPDARIV